VIGDGMHSEYDTTCSWFLADDEPFHLRWPSLGPIHVLPHVDLENRRVLAFLLPSPSSPPLLDSAFLGHSFHQLFTLLSLMTSFVPFISHTQFLNSLRHISTTCPCRQTDSPRSFFESRRSIRIAGSAQRIYRPPVSVFDFDFCIHSLSIL